MRTYICIYFGSAYLALLTTPLVIWLARRVGAVDYPGIRSVHTQPIPRIGGIAIYLSSMCLIVSLFFLNNLIGERFRDVKLQVVTLLCSATCVFLIGVVDDLRGLPARIKFMVELLGAGALCLAGVRIDNIGFGGGTVISLGWLGYPITLLWIVGVTNAVNMCDGLDGLAAGITTIACGTIAIFAIYGSTIHTGLAQSNDVLMSLFAMALLGSLSGFLFFNFNPAKVFMGDCGSLFIGFTIAAASVMCVSKSTAVVGLALPALALGIPIFDALFSMLRRFLERRSLFAPDRSHFHHRLLAVCLNQRRAVLIIYAATFMAAGLGLLMMISGNIRSLAVFGVVLCLILLLFRAVGAIRLKETLACLQSKYMFTHGEREDRRVFEHLQLQFRQARDAGQSWQAIFEAARQMDFAWVLLKTTREDGQVEEELWRTPDTKLDLSRVVKMTIPLRGSKEGLSRQLEVAICVNGSLEAASRRATLIGRIIDEQDLAAIAPIAGKGRL